MSDIEVREEQVVAEVSPRSRGDVSLFDPGVRITAENVDRFRSDAVVTTAACNELIQRGFEVLQVGETTVTIAGTPSRFEEVFGITLTKTEQAGGDAMPSAFFSAPEPTEQLLGVPDDLRDLVEGVALAVPPILFESPLPPIVLPHKSAYYYLRVPADVGLVINANRVHRSGARGLGIKVAMVDTGFYAHPFYNRHGYRASSTILGPGTADPAVDSHGHGTAEAANIFAASPDAQLIPVKMGADATGAFKAAVDQSPDIITNSWGYSVDTPGTSTLPAFLKPLEAAVADAVAKGIVVCFAAGNGHHAFPGSHPDVISVGGVHVNYPKLDLEASSYASSFTSSIYPGRNVPDLCGLVGRNANGRAPLIMLPVPPLSTLDSGLAGGGLPDGTATDDGWALLSGTSAACPQVAGVVALLLERDPSLTPKQVRDILKKSATDVKTGTTAMGHAAANGADLATGAGLVNAKWAWLITMGEVASAFFTAPVEKQAEMISSGVMPRVTREFMEDLVETLRSR